MMKRLMILILLLPSLVSSDPGPATRYLMNEPASIFDLGMLRAERDLINTQSNMSKLIDQRYGREVYYEIGLRYEFDNDLLVFVLNLAQSGDDKAVCSVVLDAYTERVDTFLSKWFSHVDYQSTDQPDDLMKNLRKRTQIVCSTANAAAYKMLTDTDPSWKGDPE